MELAIHCHIKQLMDFLSQPQFWAFLTTLFGGIFGSIRLYFVYLDRSNVKKASLDSSLENLKADNIQKSVDFLNSSIAEIRPMVARHEILMKDLENSTKMVSMIEHEMKGMFADLSHQYEEFQRKLQNITVSFQTTIDRVDAFDKRLSALGKVIVKP